MTKIYDFKIYFNENEVKEVTYYTDDMSKINFLDSFLRDYKKRDSEILAGNIFEFDAKVLKSIYDKYDDWSDMLNVIIDKNHLALDNLYPEFGTYGFDTNDFIESFLITAYDIFGFDLCNTLEFGSDIYPDIIDLVVTEKDKKVVVLDKEEAEKLINEKLDMNVKIK